MGWVPGGPLGSCSDNRRSRLDSPFCVITQHGGFEFGHHRQSKKISNAQELTTQLSQTLSSAIAQIKVSNSPITNHTNKILPQRPPHFFFKFLYNLKINFLYTVLMGGGGGGGREFPVLFFFFCFRCCCVVEERFRGFNWCIPFKKKRGGGGGGRVRRSSPGNIWKI